jgi:hypothetical protein
LILTEDRKNEKKERDQYIDHFKSSRLNSDDHDGRICNLLL